MKRRDWRGRRSDQSSWCGPARKNSPGRISARQALSKSQAACSGDGTITAWEFHNYNSGAAGIRPYYEIANQRIVFHPTRSPLRQGSYRALAATANHFARESHMDELAHLVNMDPLEFRLKNLKNERLRAVFEAAAKKFGWGKANAAGHGFGIGGGYEKAGNIATFAEVKVDRNSGEVKVVRVLSAFECGAIVNPDNLRNQIEGSNVMGSGGALFEAIEFENGRILNGRFSSIAFRGSVMCPRWRLFCSIARTSHQREPANAR